MTKLTRYFKAYWSQILAVLALLFLQAMCDLSLPDYMSDIVNNGVAAQDLAYILPAGGKMLLVALVGAGCTVAVGLIAARIAAGISRDLRNDVFSKVEGFSLAEFDRFGASSLITRTTNDIQQIQMVTVMLLRFVLYAPIQGIGGVIKAVGKSPSMSWLIALAVLVILGVILVLFSIVLPRFKVVQKLVDRLNRVTRESLVGMLVIRAFNNQGHEEARFDEANRDLTRLNTFVHRIIAAMMPTMMLVMNALTVGIVDVYKRQTPATSAVWSVFIGGSAPFRDAVMPGQGGGDAVEDFGGTAGWAFAPHPAAAPLRTGIKREGRTGWSSPPTICFFMTARQRAGFLWLALKRGLAPPRPCSDWPARDRPGFAGCRF